MGKKSAVDVRIRNTSYKVKKVKKDNSQNIKEFQNFLKTNLTKTPDKIN